MIKNTKLGIPDSLLIAFIFVSGLVNPIIMIGLILYVLLCEKGERVKDAAKKALMLFGLFAVLQGGLSVLDCMIRILLSDETGYNTVYANFSYILSGAQVVTYMVMGLKEAGSYMALRGSGVYMQKEEPVTAPEQPVEPTQQIPASAPQAAVCPVCGNPIDKGVHFCKKCGAKTTQ